MTVVTPVNAYEPAVLSNNPVAYYRFNETGDSLSVNLPAFDYIGGDNGVYGVGGVSTVENLYYGILGPQPTDGYPGFEDGNGAIQLASGYNSSQITVPSWPINTNTITLTAWVYPLGTEAAFDGLIVNRGANVAGLNYSSSTDANGNYTLGYTWNNDGNTYGWNSGLVPPANQWSLVALVVTSTNATVYLANTNGMTFATHTYPHVIQSFSGPVAIGNDPSGSSGSRVFNGSLDEVAVFARALSQDQIAALFASASGISAFAPAIAVQPSPQNPYAQENVQFAVGASGSQPLNFQWQYETNGVFVNVANGGQFAGATTATLTISNVNLSDPTNYQVIVSNSLGSAVSSPAALVVETSSYASAVLGNFPTAYYSFNETGNPAGGGLTAYDYAGGFNGIYGTAVQNGFDGISGPLSADGYPEFTGNNWAAQIIPGDSNGHLTVDPWNLNTNTVTITCWIRPAGVAPAWSGLAFSRGAEPTQVGLNFSGSTDANGNRTLSYTWGDDSGWDSQLAPPTNQWSFVTWVVTPTNATIYLMNTNGASSASVAGAYAVQGFAGATMIGCDPYDASGRNFNGAIDELAIFNRALSPNQVSALYAAAQTVSSSVTLTSVWNGSNLTLTWPGTGILLQAANITGPWTTNASPSPFILNPSTNGPGMFYRIKVQ